MSVNIPGITDLNVEFFASDYPKSKALYNGAVVDFWQLPKVILDRVTDMALSDRVAMKTLRDEGVFSEGQMVEVWVWCNLGRYDTVPDLDTKTGKFNLEYHDCGKRGKCPWEFKRCKRVKTEFDSLTPRETDYARQAAMGYTDNEIAAKLNLKPKSMISLAQRVREKVGVSSRAGLASWAMRVMI